MKIFFILANSVDPDEMPHHVAFHLGLHCLPKKHIGATRLIVDFETLGFYLVLSELIKHVVDILKFFKMHIGATSIQKGYL